MSNCQMCEQERPHEQIGVCDIDISEENGRPLGTFKVRFRYCRDNKACILRALKLAEAGSEWPPIPIRTSWDRARVQEYLPPWC